MNGKGELMKVRAKRLDNNEIIEGQLIKSNFSTFVVTMVNTIIDTSKSKHEQERIDSLVYYKVAPESVCKDTGIRDINENIIWENDKVKITLPGNHDYGKPSHTEIGTMVYDKLGMLSLKVETPSGRSYYSDILFECELSGCDIKIQKIE